MDSGSRTSMWKRFRRRVLFAGVAVGTAVALLPGVSSAWMSWSGIDPAIDLGNGHTMNVYIGWPSEYTCDAGDLVTVAVSLPQGLDATVTEESADGFACADGTVVIATDTSLGSGNQAVALLDVSVDTDASFPVRVRVSLDGEEVKVLNGHTNGAIKGAVPLGDAGA